jgi:hypothetical protein
MKYRKFFAPKYELDPNYINISVISFGKKLWFSLLICSAMLNLDQFTNHTHQPLPDRSHGDSIGLQTYEGLLGI